MLKNHEGQRQGDDARKSIVMAKNIQRNAQLICVPIVNILLLHMVLIKFDFFFPFVIPLMKVV